MTASPIHNTAAKIATAEMPRHRAHIEEMLDDEERDWSQADTDALEWALDRIGRLTTEVTQLRMMR